MISKFLLSAATIIFLFLGWVSPVFAVEVPQFPSCVAPSGTVIASYDSGIHGIPGSTNQYSGVDTVYALTYENALQCFCPPDGNGIQTKWLKLSEISEEELDSMIKLGWVYIPDGSAWGLSASAYLAKNDSFNCLPSGGGVGGWSAPGPGSAPVCTDTQPPAPTLISVTRSGASATLTWTAVTPVTYYTISYGTAPGNYQYGVPNTGNTTSYTIGSLDTSKNYYFEVRAVNNCMPSEASVSPIGGGQVLGASTFKGEVLGLASTGNLPLVLASVLGGFGLLTVSVVGLKKYRD